MNRNELKKIIRGPIETVPTPFDKKLELDLPCMADRIEFYIQEEPAVSLATVWAARKGAPSVATPSTARCLR